MERFKEEKVTGLMGLTIVLTEVNEKGLVQDEVEPFKISADKLGIRFSGRSSYFDDPAMLNHLAKAVDRAWRAYQVAKPKILNERGH